MIEQVKNVISKQRMSVLSCNIESFDIVAKSYIREIEKRPAEFQELTFELSGKIEGFKSFRKDVIPPLVCQRKREKRGDWLNRCYVSGGYGEVSE